MVGGNDLLIAAIAQANRCTLVTQNTTEFSRANGDFTGGISEVGEGPQPVLGSAPSRTRSA